MEHSDIWWVIVILLAFVGVLQLLPLRPTNPPVEAEVPAPAPVRAILRRSCYDCHSNATHWPWYSWVAPFSWPVVEDVRGGRAAMNFTAWNHLSAEERVKTMRAIARRVRDREMPPWLYLLAHSKARPSAADRATLERWAMSPIASH